MAYSKQSQSRASSSGTGRKRQSTSCNQNRRQSSTGQNNRKRSGSASGSSSGRTQMNRSGSRSSKSSGQTFGRRSSSNQRYDDFERTSSDGRRRSAQTGNRHYRRQRTKKKSGCLGVLFPIFAAIVCLAMLFFVVRSCSKTVKENISPTVLSAEVLAYETEVTQQARENGISEYVPILLCIMMQESKGKGTDPMQSSECIYNTRYARTADSIQDPSYSIECGVRYFADALDESRCTGLEDTNALMLAIQGYNFGHGYVSWALSNYDGYSSENAEIFSTMVQEELEWTAYGDPEYAEKVMTFYHNSYGT